MRVPGTDSADLAERLRLVRDVLARTDDPLGDPLRIEFAPWDARRHLAAWRDFAARAQAGSVHGDAVLYLHVPFCARLCSYCLLSSRRTPGKSQTEAYVRALCREMELYAPLVEPLRFSALHVGGGTPSLLTESQLDELLTKVHRSFQRSDGFQSGVECHPATTTEAKLEVMRRHGVGRVSFGVETFTQEVLRNVNRSDQTAERVHAAVGAAKRAGLSVNVDLLAGLPGETEESFADSVRRALELAPDSLSVNRFLAENSPLASFGYAPSDGEDARTGRMLLVADRIIHEQRPPRWPEHAILAPAYGTQYVWDISADARPYFQQDMIGPASTLALGHGGMGHIHGGLFSIAAGEPGDYVAALERGEPPPVLIAARGPRFETAFYAADRACRGALSAPEFARVFRVDLARAFGPELAFLRARGLVSGDGERWWKPASPVFQVTHLLAFLACSEAELRESAARLGPAPRPHAAALRRGRPWLHAGEAPPMGAAAVELLDSAGADLPAVVAGLRAAGIREIALWTTAERLRAALGAGATEVVVHVEPEGPAPKELTPQPIAVTAWVRVQSPLSPSFVEELCEAGVGTLLFEIEGDLEGPAAQELLRATAARRVKVETLRRGARLTHQYHQVRAELPPSLLWCRIAIRATYASRRPAGLTVLRY